MVCPEFDHLSPFNIPHSPNDVKVDFNARPFLWGRPPDCTQLYSLLGFRGKNSIFANTLNPVSSTWSTEANVPVGFFRFRFHVTVWSPHRLFQPSPGVERRACLGVRSVGIRSTRLIHSNWCERYNSQFKDLAWRYCSRVPGNMVP